MYLRADHPREVTSLPADPARSERPRKLNATSYVVLGMLCYGPATSYQLKQRVGRTIGNFWAFAHSQLYDEPARLVSAGLVSQSIEQGGHAPASVSRPSSRGTCSAKNATIAGARLWSASGSPSAATIAS